MSNDKLTLHKRFSTVNLLNLYPSDTSSVVLADTFGVGRLAIHRWRSGSMSFSTYEADRHAIRLGYHPSEIWFEWFDQIGDAA